MRLRIFCENPSEQHRDRIAIADHDERVAAGDKVIAAGANLGDKARAAHLTLHPRNGSPHDTALRRLGRKDLRDPLIAMRVQGKGAGVLQDPSLADSG